MTAKQFLSQARRIDKIIDNYYTKKLLEETKWCFIVRDLDYKFIPHENNITIKTKKKKYSNKYYEGIAVIKKDEAVKYLLNYDKFRERNSKVNRKLFR